MEHVNTMSKKIALSMGPYYTQFMLHTARDYVALEQQSWAVPLAPCGEA